MKQQTGAFCYRFWSKYMPELSHYQKKGETAPTAQVENEKSRKKILEAVRAVEMHMMLSCIAMGILQILTLELTGRISSSQLRYQRTQAKERISEAALMYYLRKHIFRLMRKHPDLRITQLIQNQQAEQSEILIDLLVS